MQFVDKVVDPALAEVAQEFHQLGYDAHHTTAPNAAAGSTEHTLVVHMPGHRDFHYCVAAVEAPAPMFGSRSMQREIDVYYRLEVFTLTGTEGYDLMGLVQRQVIDDVIDRYEAHLSFLQYSAEDDYPSVITPPVSPAIASLPQIPEDPKGS